MSGIVGDSVPVIIFFDNDHTYVRCGRRRTLAHVRKTWQLKLEAGLPVAFFSPGGSFLPDDTTVSAALKTCRGRTLELFARLQTSFWIHLFGFEAPATLLKVAPCLPPAVVRQEMVRSLGVTWEEFRLTCGEIVLDQDVAFRDLDVPPCALLTLDLKLRIVLRSDERTLAMDSFASETVGEVRQRAGIGEDEEIVATSRSHVVLSDSMQLCHIVETRCDLDFPIELEVRRKILVPFELLEADGNRKKISISLWDAPLELYEAIRNRFSLTGPFRLRADGKLLDNFVPLCEQLPDLRSVIQVDVLPPETQSNTERNFVYLYSVETMKVSDKQRLLYDYIRVTFPRPICDVFKTPSEHRSCLLVNCDELCSSFDFVTSSVEKQSFGHAGRFPFSVNHMKITTKFERWLSAWVLARKSRDIRNHLEQILNYQRLRMSTFCALQEELSVTRRHHLQLQRFERATGHRTLLEVMVRTQRVLCSFQAAQVTFSDVVSKVGKMTKIPFYRLLRVPLFCCGCGRRVSESEEARQRIPAACCKVRSLRLSDRSVRDFGTQTAISQKQNVATGTLDIDLDSNMNTDNNCGITSIYVAQQENSPEKAQQERTATVRRERKNERSPIVRATFSTLRVLLRNPNCSMDKSLVIPVASNSRVLSAIAAQQLNQPFDEAAIIFCEEWLYIHMGKMRLAVRCFDATSGTTSFYDVADGSQTHSSCWMHFRRRILRPTFLLPSLPNVQPVVFIQPNTEILTTAPNKRRIPLPVTALQDGTFVLMACGIRVGEKLFWKDQKGRFFDAQSGRVFKLEKIGGDAPKRHFLYLLRRADRVPQIVVPPMRSLLLFKRAGLSLRMYKSCVHLGGGAVVDLDCWNIVGFDSFYYEFISAASGRVAASTGRESCYQA